MSISLPSSPDENCKQLWPKPFWDAGFGADDLSIDLGIARQFDDPKLFDAVARIEGAFRRTGKLLGMPFLPHSPVQVLENRRHQIIFVDSDVSMFRRALTETLGSARMIVKPATDNTC